MTQLSFRSHPRHLVEKRTAQEDTIKDITSASWVNSYFPYRLSSASLTFNIYFFYIFLYLYITRIIININTPHLNLPKNQNKSAALGRPAIKLLGREGGGLELVCCRPTLALETFFLKKATTAPSAPIVLFSTEQISYVFEDKLTKY